VSENDLEDIVMKVQPRPSADNRRVQVLNPGYGQKKDGEKLFEKK
jgi:hypothetical protein